VIACDSSAIPIPADIVPEPPTVICTLSNTHHETDIPVAGTGITAPGPLQTQLTQVLAGPNGAAVQAELNALGVLGPPGGPASKQFIGSSTTISLTIDIGPGTVLFGPDFLLSMFIPTGDQNFNFNTHFENFFDVFSGSQALTSKGVNWLSGDLYGTVQSTLLDDGFHFTDMLFGLGHAGTAPAAGSAQPMGFAPAAWDDGATEFPYALGALSYAGTSPMATKAPPRAAVNLPGGWSAWIAGSGTFAKLDGSANNFGFGYRTSTISGGVEKRTGYWLYGGAFSVGKDWISQDTTTDSASIDTRKVGVYAAYQPSPFNVTFALAYGNDAVSANRLTLLPGLGTQTGYHANSLDAGVEVSRTYLWNAINLQPMLGLVYDGLWTNGFLETGPSLLAINGAAAYVAALKGYAGGRAYRTYTLNGIDVTPELRARVVYDLLDDQRGLNASFVADPAATNFAVTGLQPDRTAALLGAGVAARFTPVWQAFASYDADLSRNEVAQIVSGGVKAAW